MASKTFDELSKLSQNEKVKTELDSAVKGLSNSGVTGGQSATPMDVNKNSDILKYGEQGAAVGLTQNRYGTETAGNSKSFAEIMNKPKTETTPKPSFFQKIINKLRGG